MRMYIAVLDDVPDFMVPTLVSHTTLGAHLKFSELTDGESKFPGEPYYPKYIDWLENSFRKCVIRVNQKEFDKICEIPNTYLGHENTTLDGRKSCAIPCPVNNANLPNVLKFAKLWKPKVIT